jgi:S1-C subfamily serine protease
MKAATWGLVLVALAALLAAGAAAGVYGVGVARSPSSAPLPAALGLSPSARAALRAEPTVLARDAATRRAEMITMRVRNISCGQESVGSAFAINAHTLVTNRHVIAGAAVLELDAWDGAAIEADVAQARSGRLVDVGIVSVSQTLPAVAQTGPAPERGDRVTAVGYPLGGPLTLSPGEVLGYLDGRKLGRFGFDGRVIEISAAIRHGNSGGPLLDARGRVVGVVYAGQFAPGATQRSVSQLGLAIPIGAADRVLAQGASESVKSCQP